jgi:hypothetical protein
MQLLTTVRDTHIQIKLNLFYAKGSCLVRWELVRFTQLHISMKPIKRQAEQLISTFTVPLFITSNFKHKNIRQLNKHSQH